MKLLYLCQLIGHTGESFDSMNQWVWVHGNEGTCLPLQQCVWSTIISMIWWYMIFDTHKMLVCTITLLVFGFLIDSEEKTQNITRCLKVFSFFRSSERFKMRCHPSSVRQWRQRMWEGCGMRRYSGSFVPRSLYLNPPCLIHRQPSSSHTWPCMWEGPSDVLRT